MAASTDSQPFGSTPRQRALLAAAVLGLALLFGIALVALLADPGSPDANSTGDIPPARIIERPNQGQAPEDPGDRGGWEQLGLLAIIVGTMAGIGVVVAKGGGAKAKANRAAWRAAAASGHDGALDDEVDQTS